ncbi:MAG: hypothetical protein ABIJ12_08810 [bacterium]
MRNRLLFIFIFLFVTFSVRAEAPFSVSSFIHIPSEESKSFKGLEGLFEHPRICPLDRNIISFEMRTETGLRLYWYNILQDSLVEIAPPVSKNGESDILEEFGMTIRSVAPENYGLDWCPIISPYGEIVAVYTHSNGDMQDVYLYYLNENKNVLLTDNQKKDKKIKNSSPRWSPDGSMIAFQSDRSGESNIYLLTGIDKFLSFPKKYSPNLYSLAGNNKIFSPVISWNPNKQTGILAFTEFLNLGPGELYSTSSFISLPDSQSIWMMIDSDKNSMLSPSWDPLYGDRVAFYYYKGIIYSKKEDREYNINIRKVSKNKQEKVSINPISDLPINESPVIVDEYHGPVWLDNSNYILYLQKNNDGTTSMNYGDVSAWTNRQKPWNGELLSSDKYKNMRFLSLEKQRIAFVSEVNDSTFIIIGKLTGEGAAPSEKPEYKLTAHPHYAEFVNQIGLSHKESFFKKIALKPVGGKDFIINRPIIGIGISALIIFLNNNGDEGTVPGNVWDDLPDPPNPGN